MRSGDKAWVVLGVGVIAWEIWGDELLSEAADRWMLRHPWKVRIAAFLVAGHVCNALPSRLDPIHWLFASKTRASDARPTLSACLPSAISSDPTPPPG